MIIFALLMKESCRWINGITKYCHKAASIDINYFLLHAWSIIITKSAVLFPFYFDSLQLAVSFVWISKHLRFWRLFLLWLLSVFPWKYIYCLRFMLQLSRENISAAALIHAHSNESPWTQADFPAKKSSRFEDQKVYVIAALIYFLGKIRLWFGETELSS